MIKKKSCEISTSLRYRPWNFQGVYITQVLEIPRVNSGFCQKTVAWFKLYLSDRAFKVNINNHFSDSSKINCGNPQGSMLGPLLFLLYFNDMPQAAHSDLLLYVENSSLTFQHKHVHTIEHQLNKDFTNLCECFVENKLSIHLGKEKPKCILFGSKLKLKMLESLI